MAPTNESAFVDVMVIPETARAAAGWVIVQKGSKIEAVGDASVADDLKVIAAVASVSSAEIYKWFRTPEEDEFAYRLRIGEVDSWEKKASMKKRAGIRVAVLSETYATHKTARIQAACLIRDDRLVEVHVSKVEQWTSPT